jgi:hypothetical protein
MICTECGELMDQTDKNTFTGRVIREYACRKCGHTDWEDEGVALWQVLHDARERDEAAAAARSSPASPTRTISLPAPESGVYREPSSIPGAHKDDYPTKQSLGGKEMPQTVAGVESKTFNKPDEVRRFEKGKVEIVNVGGSMIARATFEPGWKWSTCVKPIAKTNSCTAAHFGYQLSGTLVTRMDDGTETTSKAGDVLSIPPGHDAWVVGNEPVVVLDFQGMANYAKPK